MIKRMKTNYIYCTNKKLILIKSLFALKNGLNKDQNYSARHVD